MAGLFGVADARAADLTFDLRIENGRVPANMRLIRVKQGDVVRLRWRADRRTEIHLHGYDITRTVEPGAMTELSFTARAAGRFTVEPHVAQQSREHSHGSVLATIEVYP
jgi:hypothetical protein